MAQQRKTHPQITPFPMFPHETIYIGVDVGKFRHVAGFLSRTLLARHERFEGCPTCAFEQSREGFRTFVDRIREYTPLEQAVVLCVRYNQQRLFLTGIMYTLRSLLIFSSEKSSQIIHNLRTHRALSPTA